MRSGAKAAVIGGVFAAMVGAAGYGVYGLVGDPTGITTDNENAAASAPEPVRTGPPSAAEVRDTAQDFLAAWAAGDPAGAAALTDDAEAARIALMGYRTDAHVTKVAFKPGAGAGTSVPFTVTADISSGGQRATWAYASSLTVVREQRTGRALVAWRPAVVHPSLGPGEKLRTGEAGAPPIKAVDRNGEELTKDDFPSLAGVLSSLRERYGDTAGGQAGVEVWAEAEEGGEQPDETLKVLSKGKPGTLRTTLDADSQRAAEAAVRKYAKASVVAVKPSTGEILAVANSPADGFNTALQGSFAPGSTMKIISAATLLDKGLAANDRPHPCPKYASYGGWRFQNLDEFEIPGGTFAQSFARSCNTAFITQAEKLDDDALTKEARDVFGIGLNWQTGVPTFDGRVPVQTAASKAASLIGQGGVRMNPLNMASVAATARTGVFRQPYLVSPSLDDRALATAPRSLAPGVAQQLRDLMRLTATAGTGATAMAGLGGDIGAKTGSAEVDGQKKPNGWFTAYRDDLAVAAVVPEGGHGGDSAGPVVRAVLAP
jgi:hypothetical protein